MRRWPGGESALWTAAALVVLVAARVYRPRAYAPARPAAIAPLRPLASARPDSLAAWAERFTDADPFRLERRPADVAYRPELEGAPPPPPGPPKPALALQGILGGPPWEAIVEGLPGREGGVVVRVGDRAGALLVRRVTRDTVVIAGLDTTWTLTMRSAWR
jgi:hypothetical protein